MAADLTRALDERSVQAAAAMVTADATMDQLHREMFARTLAPSWRQRVEAAVDASLLGRFFERFADQAVSNAQRVQFIVTGSRPE